MHNYNVIKAEPYLCVAACFEMIFATHNIIMDQIDIGNYFGVNVDDKYSGRLNSIKITDDYDKLGIVLKKHTINNFFKEYGLPFYETFYSVNNFEDWSFYDAIVENLNRGHHIICGVSYGSLFRNTRKIDFGHAILIENANNNLVSIIDPGPQHFGRKNVDPTDLFVAVHKKKDGLWVITQTE